LLNAGPLAVNLFGIFIDMSIFKKTGYLRALFVGLPFGVVSLFGGIVQFNNIPESVENLELQTGNIIDYGMTEYYDKGVDVHRDVYFFEIDSLGEFYSDLNDHTELLKSIEKEWINSYAEIWIKENNPYIKQLRIDNNLIIEYKPPYWMAWTFTLIGILFTTMSIFYLIRYSSDYFN
jgi:hypothetical protein